MSDNDNPNHDEFEYAGVFDDATMADFTRETSAKTEVLRKNMGHEAFTAFVDEQIRTIRTAWIASETYMQPIAIVANHEKQRIFTPDEDETLRQFIARMHREAVAMDAIWTFVAKRNMVASLGASSPDDEYSVDVSDPEQWQQAIADGLVRLGVVWYAERREDGNRERRHGQMQDEEGTLGRLREGAPNQNMPLFTEILGN